MDEKLNKIITEIIGKKDVGIEEVLHYFYHIGGRDGLLYPKKDKSIDFKSRLEEFVQNNTFVEKVK